MINKDKKLATFLKKLYEDKEFSTTFQDEIYSLRLSKSCLQIEQDEIVKN